MYQFRYCMQHASNVIAITDLMRDKVSFDEKRKCIAYLEQLTLVSDVVVDTPVLLKLR